MTERWKQCHPNYEVSDQGRVRRTVGGKGARVGRVMHLKPAKCSGYVQVTLSLAGRQRTALVHWLVADAFFGPRPTRLDVNHKNGNKADNRLENLEYTTRQGNCQHAYDTGLRVPTPGHVVGEQHGQAKLDEPRVRLIRELRKAKVSLAEVATRFGVAQSTVSLIANFKLWKHLDAPSRNGEVIQP